MARLWAHFRELGIAPADRNQLGWIGEHADAVLEYVRARYTELGYAPSTLRVNLEALANVLLAIDKHQFKETVRPLFLESMRIQAEINRANDASELTPAEQANFAPYPELVRARDDLATFWRADRTSWRLNMAHLILALNTYIPPLRLDWLDMRIYPPRLGLGSGDDEFKGEPPRDAHNYLWEYAPGRWAIVLNADKVAAKQGRAILRLEDEIPHVTQGAALNAAISESLAAKPRNWVLVSQKRGVPMSGTVYDGLLAQIFRGRTPTQNLLRKAYINHWHRQRINGREPSDAVLRAIAARMRHTLETARSGYRKINAEG